MLMKNWKIHKKSENMIFLKNVFKHPGSAPGQPRTEIWKKCI